MAGSPSLLSKVKKMTIDELITQVNEEKPNTFSNDKQTEFINQIESDIVDFLGGRFRRYWEQYVYTRDKDEELIAKPPYDRLYKDYLKAQIDYALEEYQSYANNQAQFMQDFDDFKSFAIRMGMVEKRLPKRVRNWF